MTDSSRNQGQDKLFLDEALLNYTESDKYPFHMPGHKRRRPEEWLPGEEKQIMKTGIGKCQIAESPGLYAASGRIGENQQTQRSTQKPGTGAANAPTAASSCYISWSPEQIDITEIDGFDNLHHAEGILKEGQERLATLFGADQSYYLVNGSTAGILAAVSACAPRGSRILIARNCHKSVYHAVRLRELRTEYVYPQETDFGIQGSIDPEQVQRKLEEFPDIAAVVITSPTYDGVVSDIRAIAQAVHARGIPLIVDSAHGAHFGFSGLFPKKAITLGADIAVESLHKTLPSFTQTAVLHIQKTVLNPRKQEFCGQQAEEETQADASDVRDAETGRQGKEWSAQSAPKGAQRSWRVLPEQVEQYLDIFQTSSPSYILMAGIDRCVRLLEQDGDRLFAELEERLLRFYKKCAAFCYVEVLDAACFAGAEGKERAVEPVFWTGEARIQYGAEYSGNAEGKERDMHPVFRRGGDSNGAATKECPNVSVTCGENEKALPGRGIFGRDISKVLISAARAGLTGQQFYDLLLHKHHLQMEMASGHYVTALTSVMDTEEGFDRLYEALAGIENTAASRLECLQMSSFTPLSLYAQRKKSMEIAEALELPKKRVRLEAAAGMVSADFVCLYPPGIPIIAPGEWITEEVVALLAACRSRGMQLTGLADADNRMVWVLDQAENSSPPANESRLH